MTFWAALTAIFMAGSFGGLVNALLAGGLHLPRVDRRARVWRPGWLGNVVVGGTAAIVFWGLYGPMASAQVLGVGDTPALALHAAELLGALLTGIGGGRLLNAEIDRRVLGNEKRALEETKTILADTLLRVGSAPAKTTRHKQ